MLLYKVLRVAKARMFRSSLASIREWTMMVPFFPTNMPENIDFRKLGDQRIKEGFHCVQDLKRECKDIDVLGKKSTVQEE